MHFRSRSYVLLLMQQLVYSCCSVEALEAWWSRASVVHTRRARRRAVILTAQLANEHRLSFQRSRFQYWLLMMVMQLG